MNHEDYMKLALVEAKLAFDEGEIPIGAIIVKNNSDSTQTILAQTHNTRESALNPLTHAEMTALEMASQKLGNWRLDNCTLYVTLEPCPMCLGALLQARIPQLVFGAHDPKRPKFSFHSKDESKIEFPSLKTNQTVSGNNHELKIESGLLQTECSDILKEFFKNRRK